MGARFIVILQDGIEPETASDIADALSNVKGVYSVETIDETSGGNGHASHSPKRCPDTPYLFGDADALSSRDGILPRRTSQR